MAAHKDIFQKCEKSIYNYFNSGCFSLPRGDMPKICMRKPRKREKITHKIDKKYRQNRTLDDYKNFKMENPNITEVQMDSVIGVIGGKVLLTLQLESGLMLAQIRDTNNSLSVIDYFDMLEQKFDTDNFKKIFPVILSDNGSEFSNPAAIETSIHSKQQRTKDGLITREVDKNDRRNFKLHITDKALRLIPRINEIIDDCQNKITENLTAVAVRILQTYRKSQKQF